MAVIQTMTMHTPYKFPGRAHYHERVERRLDALGVTKTRKADYRMYRDIYAAIAYTDVQKQISKAENAELAAAIGADETMHFVVLQLIARGFVVPPDSTKNVDAATLAPAAAKLAARSFIVTIDGSPGLDDTGLAYYDVTQ